MILVYYVKKVLFIWFLRKNCLWKYFKFKKKTKQHKSKLILNFIYQVIAGKIENDPKSGRTKTLLTNSNIETVNSLSSKKNSQILVRWVGNIYRFSPMDFLVGIFLRNLKLKLAIRNLLDAHSRDLDYDFNTERAILINK